MTTRKILYGAGAVLLVAGAWFGYYAISPFFITIKADEALPGEARDMTEKRADSAAGSSVAVMSEAQGASDDEKQEEVKRVSVVDTPAHPASGFVRVVEADGKTYVRYEDYKTINGPDLFIYLAKDTAATEFVNLGALKATEGNINYEVPEGVDLTQYPYVLTWCKQFGVLFNSADVSPVL